LEFSEKRKDIKAHSKTVDNVQTENNMEIKPFNELPLIIFFSTTWKKLKWLFVYLIQFGRTSRILELLNKNR